MVGFPGFWGCRRTPHTLIFFKRLPSYGRLLLGLRRVSLRWGFLPVAAKRLRFGDFRIQIYPLTGVIWPLRSRRCILMDIR